MLFSLNWLREYTPVPKLSDKELLDTISVHIAEVEQVIDQTPHFTDVVVSKILKISKHPNADKLQCAEVTTDGKNKHAIVCGASNIYEGMIAPLALPGANVLDRKTGEKFKIKESEIRGELSQGMLCSGDELGIPSNADGIVDLPQDLELGTPLEKALGIGDKLIEIENKSLTHRPDLWGHIGLAREISVLFNTKLTLPQIKNVKGPADIKVTVNEDTKTRRYVAATITGIKNTPSPAWLKQRLESLDINSVNSIVDVTNMIMLEMGQPMHAFDKKLVPEIVVRNADDKEKFTTFDGTKITLCDNDVVIAGPEGPLAIAGIIGSPNSGVNEKTTEIVLESANFDPVILRGTASRHHLRTDALMRFEKNADPNICLDAIARAYELLKQIHPEAKITGITDIYPLKREPIKIEAKITHLSDIIGIPFDIDEAQRILTGLGCQVKDKGDDIFVSIPTWRGSDLNNTEELSEEIARFIGYRRLPVTMPAMPVTVLPLKEAARMRLMKDLHYRCAYTLSAYEIKAYPFSSAEMLRKFELAPEQHLKIINPQSEDATYPRSTLLPGLVNAVKENLLRQESIRMFELGQVFHKEPGRYAFDLDGDSMLPHQPIRLGIAEGGSEDCFNNLRAGITQLCESLKMPTVVFQKDNNPSTAMHPGRTANILSDNKVIGKVAEIHPALRMRLDTSRIAFAEIDIETMVDIIMANPNKAEPPPQYPESKRDIAVLINEETAVQSVVDAIISADIENLISVIPFEVFRDKTLPKGKKSITLRLTLRSDEHTLTDKEINDSLGIATATLKNIGGDIR